ncbi:hypothetical protein [Mesonia sp. K7]|uniref:DUF6913 domain-containing protein n=1 Tax=Mesonia sp. K7 TaxID=2218606 RepID=UPI0011B6F924|nr:hypothetical protein [Mesonia sp. K7]
MKKNRQKQFQQPINAVSEIKKMGVIYNAQETQIEALKAALRKNFPNVAISEIAFVHNEKGERLTQVFSKKSFSLSGKIKKDSYAQSFSNQNFDVQINFFQKENPFLLALSSLAKGNIKIGFPLSESQLNHLEFKMALDEETSFAEEVKNYLEKIK